MSEGERPEFDVNDLPLPIVHRNFEFQITPEMIGRQQEFDRQFARHRQETMAEIERNTMAAIMRQAVRTDGHSIEPGTFRCSRCGETARAIAVRENRTGEQERCPAPPAPPPPVSFHKLLEAFDVDILLIIFDILQESSLPDQAEAIKEIITRLRAIEKREGPTSVTMWSLDRGWNACLPLAQQPMRFPEDSPAMIDPETPEEMERRRSL